MHLENAAKPNRLKKTFRDIYVFFFFLQLKKK